MSPLSMAFLISSVSWYSSASTQTEATGGKHQKTTVTHSDGTKENVPDYAKVQGILVGYVTVFLIVVTIMGPEKHGSHFEKQKTAFEEGGEDDTVVDDDNVHRHRGHEIQQAFTKRHRSNKRSWWLFDDVIHSLVYCP
ncbi:uncharacterized protein ARMOST_21451 [Armillaria ostoyae]|uniref:Uncharacterized protein n=1 Tax=Armillaria ostoyae TaxID=47428 RepID=A0A284SA57_ARMOS|nr:uncharacterized protein ARMOST_21451 [Armillaria ostoyae]